MIGPVVVLASFMMDHTAYVNRRPAPGETVRGEQFAITPGGKGFNQAIAAARSGAHVRVVGCVGDDELGQDFLRRLAGEGIDPAAIAITSESRTGVGLPVVDREGENSIVIVPGANEALRITDVTAQRELFDDATILLLQCEVPAGPAVAAAQLAKSAGAKVVLNPAPARDVTEFAGLVDVVIPNEGELAALATGSDLSERAAALSASLGGAAVVVTLGAHGAYVADGSTPRLVAGEPARVLDTVGAGDCFCGAFATHLAEGGSIVDAVEFAVVAAGISVQRAGAAEANPRRAEIAAQLNRRKERIKMEYPATSAG